MPEQAGLGVHVTTDLGGQVRCGPDVEWIEGINDDVDPRRADVFYDAVRKYYPALKDGALEPGYAGIRPKIVPRGTQAADFVIQGPAQHGIEGAGQPVRDRVAGHHQLAGVGRRGRPGARRGAAPRGVGVEQGPADHGSESNGSSRGTPRPSKSRTLRVTSVRP